MSVVQFPTRPAPPPTQTQAPASPPAPAGEPSDLMRLARRMRADGLPLYPLGGLPV